MTQPTRKARRVRPRAELLAALFLITGLSWTAVEARIVSLMHAASVRLYLPGSSRPKGDPNTPDEARTGGAARG